MKILVADLGTCGVNYQNDYLMAHLVQNFELTREIEEADTIIMLGGCCCTKETMGNSLEFIQYILDNKKENAITYLTGCITHEFKSDPRLQTIQHFLDENIDYIIHHYEPNKLLKHLSKHKFDYLKDNEFGMVDYDQDFADIYIQNGCTHNCSFCKTNYLNYRVKDAPLDEIKEIIDQLNDENIRTIQLRGLNLAQYGLDLYRDYKLMDICEYIENKANIKKIILSGVAFTDAIRGGFAEKLKYFEKSSYIVGSLESGSDRILNLMKKGFTQEEFLGFCEEINSVYKKNFILNIISGFPTETRQDCLETLKVLQDVNPKLVNINTYLDSEFVPSHHLEQLPYSQIRQHTKIYSKVLKSHAIPYTVNGGNSYCSFEDI